MIIINEKWAAAETKEVRQSETRETKGKRQTNRLRLGQNSERM